MEKILKYYGKDLQTIELEDWLAQKAEVLRPIARHWISIMEECGHGDVVRIFHDNCPICCVESAPFVYVNVFTSHLNVGFFYGAELPDPAGLLEGIGKRMRHVKLRSGEPVDEAALLKLIDVSYRDIRRRLNEE